MNEKRQQVFERLAEMDFDASEIETIGNWWSLYTSDANLDFFLTASKEEIERASKPAFEKDEAGLQAIAEAIYNEISGADNKNEHDTLVNEIYDWLYNGDNPNYTMNDVPDLVNEWNEYAG